jgi:hypothetical protein
VRINGSQRVSSVQFRSLEDREGFIGSGFDVGAASRSYSCELYDLNQRFKSFNCTVNLDRSI